MMQQQLSLNLKAMTPEALAALVADAQAALAAQERIAKIKSDIVALIESEGLTLADVFPQTAQAPAVEAPKAKRGRKPKAAVDVTDAQVGAAGFVADGRSKVAPKYRSAAGEEWTGRGRMPVWAKNIVEGGGSIDDFLIDKPQTPEIAAE